MLPSVRLSLLNLEVRKTEMTAYWDLPNDGRSRGRILIKGQ